MKQVLTIQLQVESDEGLHPDFLEDVRKAAALFAEVLRTEGYTRYGIFVDGSDVTNTP